MNFRTVDTSTLTEVDLESVHLEPGKEYLCESDMDESRFVATYLGFDPRQRWFGKCHVFSIKPDHDGRRRAVGSLIVLDDDEVEIDYRFFRW